MVVRYAFEYQKFYNRLFKSVGLHPTDIKGVSDLKKIPIVSKVELKSVPLQDLIASPFRTQQLGKISTGGSTGHPFSIYINRQEDAWRKSIYMRANITCGQKIRDVWAAIIDPQYSTSSNSFQKQIGFYFRNIVPITLERSLMLKKLYEMKIDILDGFPNAIYLLAKDHKLKGEGLLEPRIIFGSGELIDKRCINYIEKTFSAPYFDQFGCSEIDRSAWQCTQREGYHMDVDSVITQFIDEEGEEVSSGERGEIVYTSLFNFAFPIIRYNVKDVGVPISDECSCGINLPLMKVVEGRVNSFLVFAGNRVVNPMRFIEILGAFSLIEDIEQYRVIQEKIDKIRIIVKKSNNTVDETKLRNVLLGNLVKGLPNFAFSDKGELIFSVEFVEEMEHSATGKFSVVSSNVKLK